MTKNRATTKRTATAGAKATRRIAADPRTVEQFLRELDHPLAPALALVRTVILAASPGVEEGIKWKCPSFRARGAEDYFATLNVHGAGKAPDCVLLVLHRGAKASRRGAKPPVISDPAGLLQWLAADRCVVRFADLQAVKAARSALGDIVRQWVARAN